MWPATTLMSIAVLFFVLGAAEDLLKTPVPVVDWTSLGFSGTVLVLFGWLVTKHMPAMEERHRLERKADREEAKLERERQSVRIDNIVTKFESMLAASQKEFRESLKEIVSDRRDYRQHVRRLTHRKESDSEPDAGDSSVLGG